MKCVNKLTPIFSGVTTLLLTLHLFGYGAFAAEESSGWRSTYDQILLWINFGIIVFVLNKYAKTPLLNFLKGQKDKLAKEIKKLEDKKEDVAEKVKETQRALDESDARFKDLKERIVQQGERKKQDIIESAKSQSRMMLEDANRKIDSYILSSKNVFKAELIDAAIELAMERLPKEITDEDNEQLIAQYLSSASTE